MAYTLEVRGVSLRFGGVRALTEVSFGVNDGELFSIIGPNGAGKTSIVNCISGRYKPTEGQLFYRGQDITALNPNARPRLGIGRTFQNLALFHHMSVLDNIMVGRHHLLKNNFITGSLYWLTGARREELEHRRKVEEIIDFLDLQSVRKATAGTLPYGLRKRVELARAMALEPQLILLDEPMAGMNFEEKEDMARYIVDLNEEFGMTVMMIEHDMGVVMDISHRVMVLDFGRKIAEGDPAAVLADPHVKRAYLGEEDEVLVDPDDTPRACGERGMMDYAGRVAQADTYPKLLRLNAKEHGSEIALREKDLGLWRVFTWNDYQTRVHDFALGMVELGLGRGDVIGIIGDNRPDWVAAEIATHAIGGMSLGLYRDVLDEEAAYLLSYGEAKLVFAEDEEQVDKLLALADRVPNLKHIVYSDPRGMRKYDDPRLMEADKLAAMGRDRAAREPGLYDRLVDATKGEDVAILCTTSGTTANPKLAMLAAGRVLRHCATYLAFDPKGPDDEYVSVLPLPWIMEQVYALGKGLLCRMKVNFVEEPDTMMHDFREIAPTFVLFAPRVWESIAADVRAGVMDSSPLKQKLYDLGMKTGLAALAEGKHSAARRPVAVPRPARPPRLHPAALGRHRRRRARAGYVQILPGDGRAAAHALRPDRIARRLHAASGRQGRSRYDRRADGRRHRDPDRQSGYPRRRRNRGAPSQHVPRLLQESGSLRRRHEGRLDAFRRRRLFQRQQAARGDRPHQGSRRDLARRTLLAAISRKQAEILALYRRDRGARRRPRRAGGDDLHPLLDHLEMGGEEPHLVHDLYRPLLASRSL